MICTILYCLFMYFQINDFTEQSGPNLPNDFDVATASPLQYFWLLFHPTIFEDMTRPNDNYARWQME